MLHDTLSALSLSIPFRDAPSPPTTNGILVRDHIWNRINGGMLLTSSFNLRPTRSAACSSDLMTDMYESFNETYLPTNTIVTVSKRRVYLYGQKQLRSEDDRLVTIWRSPRRQLFPPGQQFGPFPLPSSSFLHANRPKIQPPGQIFDQTLLLQE